jgi:hypothetical protein
VERTVIANQRWHAVAWMVAALLSLRLGVSTWKASAVPANGFVTHWTASRLALRGDDVAQFYDDAWFSKQVHEVEPTVTDIFGPNPPTVALAALPLAWMNYGPARLICAMLSLVIWIGGATWLARVLLPDSLLGPMLVWIATLFQPAEEGLRHAQLHIAVYGVVLVAWWHYRRDVRATSSEQVRQTAASPRADAIVGLAFGSALALKAAGSMFWVMLLAQRRWNALLWAGGSAALLAILCLPIAGPSAWLAFFARGRTLTASGIGLVTAYQTVPGLVHRLVVANPTWNPRPLMDLGPFGNALSWTAVLALVIVSAVWAFRRTSNDDATFAAFAVLCLVTSPASLDYHYSLAFLPIAILLARNGSRPTGIRTTLLALAVFLIAARLPVRSSRLNDGVLVLLAYPKLYGALLLWWLAFTEPSTGPEPARTRS